MVEREVSMSKIFIGLKEEDFKKLSSGKTIDISLSMNVYDNIGGTVLRKETPPMGKSTVNLEDLDPNRFQLRYVDVEEQEEKDKRLKFLEERIHRLRNMIIDICKEDSDFEVACIRSYDKGLITPYDVRFLCKLDDDKNNKKMMEERYGTSF